MLIRVDVIEGIGLLHDVESATDHEWKQTTLIYGENGRGKSTLASIFSAMADEEPVRIMHRKTVDGTLEPKVVLQFQNLGDTEEDYQEVIFENNKWSEYTNKFIVFDSYFIERNVYSGSSVDTSHRKNILQLALGESAVRARKDLDKANLAVKKASEKINTLLQNIALQHSGMTLERFEKLPLVTESDQAIAQLQEQLREHQKLAPFLSRPLPGLVDFDKTFEVFFHSINNSYTDTEKSIKNHLKILDYKGAENWIYQGHQISPKAHCPYCAQSLINNDLIKAYQNYFRKNYGLCKSKATQVFQWCKSNTDSRVLDRIVQAVLNTQAQIDNWMSTLGVPEAAYLKISFNPKPCEKALQKLRKLLMNRAQKKVNNPAESSANEEDLHHALQIWNDFLKPIQILNDQIAEARKTIFSGKKRLSQISVMALRLKLQEVQAAQRRHSPAVIRLIAKIKKAKEELKNLTLEQKKCSKRLDLVMRKNMLDYEHDMNECLKELGVSFSIQGMAQDIHGMATRSEYGLLLRGKPVHFDDAAPAFSYALSEGDKRTLAFAFFMTSISKREDLGQKIVVLDDPMCSMDQQRKNQTVIALKRLHGRCLQMVVLAHDLDFLKRLKKQITEEESDEIIASFEIKSLANGDSDWFAIDLI
jgi:wobble nucleotide-excising tRNase